MNQLLEETIIILKGFKRNTKTTITFKYTDAAIEAAANLSNRYIQDRFLPDKAIDLLDEAGSKMNLTLNFVDPKVIDQRLIEAENLKAQATREKILKKPPTSAIRLPNTRKCRKTRSPTRILQSSARKQSNISLSRKPISLLENSKKKNSLNLSI